VPGPGAAIAERGGDRVERDDLAARGDGDPEPARERPVVEAEERTACTLDFDGLGEQGLVHSRAEADRERVEVPLDPLDLATEAPVAIALATETVVVELAGRDLAIFAGAGQRPSRATSAERR
jgi:hypothetical protein